MSQDSEAQISQGSLAPPVEISGPVSPTQLASLSRSPELSVGAGSHISQSNKSKFISPPPLSSSDMTPPPSSQIPGAPRRSRSRSSSYFASPLDMDKTLCAAYGVSENLPTADEIDSANEMRLRTIAKDLLGVTQEARMSALHFKLQNSLLSFASNEAVKRAEVEHQLARREVEILQSPEYRNRRRPSETKPVEPLPAVELELALKKNQELERANVLLDRRLRRAKKLIEQEREKSDLLAEENSLLKKRIRDNREHFSRMIEHSSMSPSPRTEFQTPQQMHVPHFVQSHHVSRGESHDPFAALLAADKVLNRESAGIASTPYRHRAQRQHSNGQPHENSIASYPMTPNRPRTVHRENQYMTPIQNSNDDRHDRDSTISASDVEEAETDVEVPPSQASSHATTMLRHNSRGYQDSKETAKAPKSSTLLQTKLFGQVRKAGVDPPSQHLKRKSSIEEDNPPLKKSKMPERVGLGINAWNTAHS
ncbi:hypothetical protein PHISCL_00282 [Aspergillus sclerotialis]|uniref:FAD-dependent oxidoreductase-like enzyme n=1 Tax=Aspergillus sclerotialis TaxID=2070753 RepID=A0A3A2ZWI5_9EURO|nr:hypothetical protein PHISCL_00282 [Aspergillus sclerotialis]